MFFLKDPPTPKEFQDLSRRYETLDPLSMETMVKLLRTSSDLLAGFEALLGRYGLSQGRFLILVVLNRTPDHPLTPSELAGKMGVTRATMTGLIQGLERDEFISCQVDEIDKRRRMVRLTAKGLMRVEEILPGYYHRAARLMAGLDRDQKEDLIALMALVQRGIPLLSAPRITIRPYGHGDGEGILSLILSIQQGEFGLPVGAADQPDLLDIPSFYCRDKGNFWVALDGKDIVGTVGFKDIGRGMVALEKMFVAPSHRGTGTADQLLDTALAWAGDKGVGRIYLGTTDRFHAAHRFYDKKGFSRVAKEMLPAAFPVMDVDSLFFTLGL